MLRLLTSFPSAPASPPPSKTRAMSQLSKYPSPGILHVLSQPKPQYLQEYHNWYDTEHGPLRMKLEFFVNGCRYKSMDQDPPVFAATYDLSRISGLEEPQYKLMREQRSLREKNLLSNKMNFVNRRVYRNLSTRSRDDVQGPAPIMMAVAFVVKDSHVDELHDWYEEEHIPDLMRIPGWRRSRRFQLVDADGQKEGYTELLAVHEFDKDNGIDGPEHQLAKSKPWRNRIMKLVESRDNRRFEFLNQFQASDYQDPAHLNNSKASLSWDGPSFWHVDGPHNGPVIAFSNSLITDYHIWDQVIAELKQSYPEYRYLIYNTRGYSSDPGRAVTVDLLADDLADLLDTLGIEKCFAVIGVSLGGITTLNFAIRYPQRLSRFVACDCNVASSEMNSRAWRERIKLGAESWTQLADQTVKRWFTSDSVNAQIVSLGKVRKMIIAANPAGFFRCVEALCDFDISDAVREIRVPGLCVVGSQDGILPATMTQVSKSIPHASYVEVPNTGHLPMVEDPPAFVRAIQPIFLRNDRIR